MATASISQASSPWIQSRFLDMVFYIATPIFVIPLLLGFLSSSTPEGIALFTTSFFGLGHHLPSFLRAYGDRVLFKEFRVRFILGPLLLVPLATWLIFKDVKGYYFLVLLWIAWHSAAQVFGIGRIYDAKIGKTNASSSWMDWTLVIFGFFAVIMFSPWRLGGYLAVFYMTGGPYLSANTIEAAKTLVASGGGLFLIAYFIHYFSGRKLFPITNHLKLVLYTTNLSMWFFAFIVVKNVVVGLCIWEIIHFLQVVPITWKYCNFRAKNIKHVGNFLTTLFSGKAGWTALYAGMILTYGSLALVPKFVNNDFFYRLGTAVLVSSGICHFYFEGFIWRVRDRSVQAGLGIKENSGPPRWRYQHATLWVLFIGLLGFLGIGQWKSTRTSYDIYKQITQTVPRCWYSQYNFAVELEEKGDLDQAVLHFHKSIEINPRYVDSHVFLAKILLGQADYANAKVELEAALSLDSHNSLAHHFMADAFYRTGEPERAKIEYQKAIELDPGEPWSLNNLAFVFLDQGNIARAENYFAKALGLDSNYIPSKLNISSVFIRQNRYADARKQITDVLELQPENTVALEGMSYILRNDLDFQKRDSALANQFDERVHSSAAPSDPVQIGKDSKKTGSFRKPENMKIL